MLVKNSFGCSVIPNPKMINPEWINEFRGSSLDRIKDEKIPTSEEVIVEKEVKPKKEKKEKQLRSLSSRTKSKIRRKLFAFFGIHTQLSFLTLTFVNQVNDEMSLKILSGFLDNIKKQDKDFQYLWVAERQTKNLTFKDNIHFHLITNKMWNIKKHWKYWLDVQTKNGVIPRDKNFKPSSAFDVKKVNSGNAKGVSNYLTKYITKNNGKFRFMPWNCSKKISMLYTSFYSDHNIIKQLEEMEAQKKILIKRVKEDYCNVLLYPYNEITKPLTNDIHLKNHSIWFEKIKQEEAKS
ncbi:hypothetical protein FW778_12845 [Ginsengibacter hankyongi]|uniref:Replication-associated protein ORF2/G2P domain-containing protein n=1 Tax=Ginsengibacter hankyongi TaxID=2607284 RepID=A0A5J5II91_9BACT|nr:hypothetical protein [Ginsengibacter hankyongi]KAA9038447.1 hypothetical protein FW778_12845 [Ginsengibacter hankyongi]